MKLVFFVFALALIAAPALSAQNGLGQKARTVAYTPSQENFINPERGEMILYQPDASADGLAQNTAPLAEHRAYVLGQVNQQQTRLIRVVYNLGAWIDAPIPESFLKRVSNDFAFARDTGLKLVPYFVYNWPYTERAARDASAKQTVGHLEQLKPVLHDNADVLAFMYSGFIGAWGEWHDSSQGNINPGGGINENTKTILRGILDAVPQNRAVTLRYVKHKWAIAGRAPLSNLLAFGVSDQARLGFNNECFMADYHPDVKTQRLNQRSFLQHEGLFVPQVGLMDDGCFQFNATTPQSVACNDLLEELSETHMDVVNTFPTRVVGNCQPELARRVGYRFELRSSAMPDQIERGSGFDVSLSIINVGFSPPFNPRKLQVVLRHKSSNTPYRQILYRFGVQSDPRFWQPGQQQTLNVKISLPKNAPTGNYEVLFHLPDPDPKLAATAAYAIRLANQNVWEETTGFNSLQRVLTVY